MRQYCYGLLLFFYAVISMASDEISPSFPEWKNCAAKLKTSRYPHKENIEEVLSLSKRYSQTRLKVIAIMQEKLKEENAVPLVLFERCGGQSFYQCVLIASNFTLCGEEQPYNDPWKITIKKPDAAKIDEVYQKSKAFLSYPGSAFGRGCDIQTWFCTIWKDGKVQNCFSVYDVAYKYAPPDETKLREELKAIAEYYNAVRELIETKERGVL